MRRGTPCVKYLLHIETNIKTHITRVEYAALISRTPGFAANRSNGRERRPAAHSVIKWGKHRDVLFACKPMNGPVRRVSIVVLSDQRLLRGHHLRHSALDEILDEVDLRDEACCFAGELWEAPADVQGYVRRR